MGEFVKMNILKEGPDEAGILGVTFERRGRSPISRF
jgi:hypothetical protein